MGMYLPNEEAYRVFVKYYTEFCPLSASEFFQQIGALLTFCDGERLLDPKVSVFSTIVRGFIRRVQRDLDGALEDKELRLVRGIVYNSLIYRLEGFFAHKYKELVSPKEEARQLTLILEAIESPTHAAKATISFAKMQQEIEEIIKNGHDPQCDYHDS